MDIRKNLLDLHYQKNLQYYNITIVILFTYFVGLGIAAVTGEVKFGDFSDMAVVGILSIAVLGIGTVFLLRFRYHLKRIPEEIKRLGATEKHKR